MKVWWRQEEGKDPRTNRITIQIQNTRTIRNTTVWMYNGGKKQSRERGVKDKYKYNHA